MADDDRLYRLRFCKHRFSDDGSIQLTFYSRPAPGAHPSAATRRRISQARGQAGKKMSYISTLKKLYRNLLDALHYAHHACRIAERINAEIQGSNASDALKTQSANFVTAATSLCDAIQDFRDSLPGN